jgi:hypothetical protein
MFNILRHKGNANQKKFEMPSHSSQNGSHHENKQQKILVTMWGQSNTYTKLLGI